MILRSAHSSSGILSDVRSAQDSNSSHAIQVDGSTVISPPEEIDDEEDDIVEKARLLVFKTFSLDASLLASNKEVDDMASSKNALELGTVYACDRLHSKEHLHSSTDERILDAPNTNGETIEHIQANSTTSLLEASSEEQPQLQKVSHWLHSFKDEETDNPEITTDDSGVYGKCVNSSYINDIKSCKQVSAISLINQNRESSGIKKRYPLNKYYPNYLKLRANSTLQNFSSGNKFSTNRTALPAYSSDQQLKNSKIWRYFCRSCDLSDEARKGTVLEEFTQSEAQELFKKMVIEGAGGVYKPSASLRTEYGGDRQRFANKDHEVIGDSSQVLTTHVPSVATYSSSNFGENNFGCSTSNFANSVTPNVGFVPYGNYRRRSRQYPGNNRTTVLPPPPSIFSSEEYYALSVHCSKYASSCDDKSHVELIAWLILNERKVMNFDPREINSMVKKLVQHTGNLCTKEAKLKSVMEGCLERDGVLNYYKDTHW